MKKYLFQEQLGIVQKELFLLEFIEAVFIGLLLGLVFGFLRWGTPNFIEAVLQAFFLSIGLFIWWKILTWLWGMKWFIIFAGIISLGVNILIYILVYSIGWIFVSLNYKYVLSQFYIGEKNLEEIEWEPFATAFK